MSDNRPVRIGDVVKVVSERKGYTVGTVCVVKELDVLNNKVTIQKNRKHLYPWSPSIIVQLQDIDIICSPEWQRKLL